MVHTEPGMESRLVSACSNIYDLNRSMVRVVSYDRRLLTVNNNNVRDVTPSRMSLNLEQKDQTAARYFSSLQKEGIVRSDNSTG
jgi:hypothetical protein